MNNLNLLRVNIHYAFGTELDEIIQNYLRSDGCKQIVTINPEFLVRAHHDQEFRQILNQADLATIDGAGIIFMANILGKQISRAARVTGVSLTNKLLQICHQNHFAVGLILPNNPLANQQEIRLALERLYSGLKCQIYYEKELAGLNNLTADVVFVTFGASRQEKWIAAEKTGLLRAVKIAAGVGGTFDFISGKISRAPIIIQRVGLEWLWRLIKQPRRWRRIIKAIIVFPVLVVMARNSKPETRRKH